MGFQRQELINSFTAKEKEERRKDEKISIKEFKCSREIRKIQKKLP